MLLNKVTRNHFRTQTHHAKNVQFTSAPFHHKLQLSASITSSREELDAKKPRYLRSSVCTIGLLDGALFINLISCLTKGMRSLRISQRIWGWCSHFNWWGYVTPNNNMIIKCGGRAVVIFMERSYGYELR